MSIGDFYQHKAAQCDRLAVAAVDPVIRARYVGEAVLWREIAGDIERQERAEGGPP
jgi:hypothetical protein